MGVSMPDRSARGKTKSQRPEPTFNGKRKKNRQGLVRTREDKTESIDYFKGGMSGVLRLEKHSVFPGLSRDCPFNNEGFLIASHPRWGPSDSAKLNSGHYQSAKHFKGLLLDADSRADWVRSQSTQRSVGQFQ